MDQPLRVFFAKLSDSTPEPAGGAALALAAVSAAALVSLACGAGLRARVPAADGQSAGEASAEIEAHQATLRSCLESSEALLGSAQPLIDADVAAYRGVIQHLRLPRIGPVEQADNRAGLDQALHAAIEIPLLVAGSGVEVIGLVARAAPAAPSSTLGDLTAAVHLAEAATKGSLQNARINAGGLSNETSAAQARIRVQDLARRLTDAARRAQAALEARELAE